jgi:hypothetical protein
MGAASAISIEFGRFTTSGFGCPPSQYTSFSISFRW